MFEGLFFKASYKGKQQVNLNIKASSKLQLLNCKISTWNNLLENSTSKKKLTISRTERDMSTPSRAKSRKKEQFGTTRLSHHYPTFQKVLISVDLSAVLIHQLGSTEEAKSIMQILTSTLFPSVQRECASKAILVEKFWMWKLEQLTMVRDFPSRNS